MRAMEKLQFEFKNVATTDGKSNVIVITSISTLDNRKFTLPLEDQIAKNHTLIAATETFIKVKNSLKKRHQSRKIWITLTQEMKKIYFDEEGNLQFNDLFLEEEIEMKETATNKEEPMIKILEKLIENTQKSEERGLSQITKEFMIEQFNSKIMNATQWIQEFEKECIRFNVIEDIKKIEALKFLLEKPYLNWYSNMILKLSVKSEWDQWRRIFCETFGNKGWSPIRYALLFRYQMGNLVDYAIKKEKLLLEVRKTIDTGTLIDLIATGLPNFIADKIDREAIQTTEQLCHEIGKLEHFVQKKVTNIKNMKDYSQKKLPCKICKERCKDNRFHEEDKCWFNEQRKRLENNSLLDIENFEDPKTGEFTINHYQGYLK